MDKIAFIPGLETLSGVLPIGTVLTDLPLPKILESESNLQRASPLICQEWKDASRNGVSYLSQKDKIALAVKFIKSLPKKEKEVVIPRPIQEVGQHSFTDAIFASGPVTELYKLLDVVVSGQGAKKGVKAAVETEDLMNVHDEFSGDETTTVATSLTDITTEGGLPEVGDKQEVLAAKESGKFASPVVVRRGKETATKKRKRNLDAPPSGRIRKKHRPVCDIEIPEGMDALDAPVFEKLSSLVDILSRHEDESVLKISKKSKKADSVSAEEPSNPEMLSISFLRQLSAELSKLKSMGALHKLPAEHVVQIMTVADRHIHGCEKLEFKPWDESEENEDNLNRIRAALQACLICCYFLGSPKMEKNIYLEEVIEHISALVRFQLEKVIYPAYDPLYRSIGDGDEEVKETEVEKGKKKKRNVNGRKIVSVKSKAPTYSSSKSRCSGNIPNEIAKIYVELGEIVRLLAAMLELQPVSDTILIELQSIGLMPFFVKNIDELQLQALNLIRTVFSEYEQHRHSILEDIFNSIAKIPTSKRNMRTYNLAGGEAIQTVSALVLQLFQCYPSSKAGRTKDGSELDVDQKVIAIIKSYEGAVSMGSGFLSAMMNKCCKKTDETDYKSIFQNFISDLVCTLNHPEWPAAEVLLSILTNIASRIYNNKKNENSLRAFAVEILGMLTVALQSNCEGLSEVELASLKEDVEFSHVSNPGASYPLDKEIAMQKHLLLCLDKACSIDPSLAFARKFHLSIFLRNVRVKCGLPSEADEESAELRNTALREKLTDTYMSLWKTKKRLFEMDEFNYDEERSFVFKISQSLAKDRPFSRSFNSVLKLCLVGLGESTNSVRSKAMKALNNLIEANPSLLGDANVAKAVAGRFLDPSISVRESATDLVGKYIRLKPELIKEYYGTITSRILDRGVSVRARVIKILKELCLRWPDYVDVNDICCKLVRRIHDESDSITELVKKTFEELWFSTPEDGEINCYVKEGFSAKEAMGKAYLRRALEITEVVKYITHQGTLNHEWFEEIVKGLVEKPKDDKSKAKLKNKGVIKICKAMVGELVEHMIEIDESATESESSNTKGYDVCASMSTLYLFSKVVPDILVPHASFIHPYLRTESRSENEALVVHHAAVILEQTVPLIDNPSSKFIQELENDLGKLIFKHGMVIVQSCCKCLCTIVREVSHNSKAIYSCFQKVFVFAVKQKAIFQNNCDSPDAVKIGPTVMRALFILGLLCQHYDFGTLCVRDVIPSCGNSLIGEKKVAEAVFELILFYCERGSTLVRWRAVTGLGFFVIRYCRMMLAKSCVRVYKTILSNTSENEHIKNQVLKNFQMFLVEEELKMTRTDQKRNASRSSKKKLNIYGVGDSASENADSGVSTSLLQMFLNMILESIFSDAKSTRLAALQVVQLVLRQGLVHPMQCVAHIIAMEGDVDERARDRAYQLLLFLDEKHREFLINKAPLGLKKSFEYQKKIRPESAVGYRRNKTGLYTALISNLYRRIRTKRQERRVFLNHLVQPFIGKCFNYEYLKFVAENIAHLPFVVVDEPLYLIGKITNILSLLGPQVLESFKKSLFRREIEELVFANDEFFEEEENRNELILSVERNTEAVSKACIESQAAIYLLLLKAWLKSTNSLTDSKIHEYSPDQSVKITERSVSKVKGSDAQPFALPDPIEGELECQAIADHFLGFAELLREHQTADEVFMDEEEGALPMEDDDDVEFPTEGEIDQDPLSEL
eukprot:Nk52_evm50s1992 gene=Nk52_evmTU50s1992